MQWVLAVMMSAMSSGVAPGDQLAAPLKSPDYRPLDAHIRTGPGSQFLAENCQGFDNETVLVGFSVACTADGGRTVTENGHARQWQIVDDIEITQVRFGVDTCRDVLGAGDPCPIEVRLYAAPDFPDFVSAVLLGSASVEVPDRSVGVIQTAMFNAVPVSAGTVLVVEIYNSDAFRGHFGFWPGANAGGQLRPSYIRTPACGPENWTDKAVLGYPDQSNVLCWDDEPSGGDLFCQYMVKKSTRSKKGCETCPRRRDIFTTEEFCENVNDCRRRLKIKRLDCPGGGVGFCKKLKGERESCGS